MAVAGETITHPISGERITFIRTSAETDGALAEMDFYLPDGMTPCPEHIHPKSTERVTVVSGEVRAMIDGRLPRSSRRCCSAGICMKKGGRSAGCRATGPRIWRIPPRNARFARTATARARARGGTVLARYAM